MRPKIFAAILSVIPIVALAATSTPTSRAEYTADGSTAIYTFSYPVQNSGHVEVYVNDVKIATGFAVSLNASQSSTPGGRVTFMVAPAQGAVIRIDRTLPLTQTTVLPSFSQYKAKDIENTFDRTEHQIQQVDRRVGDEHAAWTFANDRANGRIDSEISDRITADNQLRTDFAAGGGGGFIDGVSILANGTTVARPLRARFADVLNVLDFGADPTGVASSQAAFQAAISADPKKPIYVPPGKYRLTARLSTAGRTEMSMYGDAHSGQASPSSLWVKEISGYLFDLDVPGELLNRFSFSGLTFDGNNGDPNWATATRSWLGVIRRSVGDVYSMAYFFRFENCNIKLSLTTGAIAIDAYNAFGVQLDAVNIEAFLKGRALRTGPRTSSSYVHDSTIHYTQEAFSLEGAGLNVRDSVVESSTTVGYFKDTSVMWDSVHFENIGYVTNGSAGSIGISMQKPGSTSPINTHFNIIRGRMTFRDSGFALYTGINLAAIFRLIPDQDVPYTYARSGTVDLIGITAAGAGAEAQMAHWVVGEESSPLYRHRICITASETFEAFGTGVVRWRVLPEAALRRADCGFAKAFTSNGNEIKFEILPGGRFRYFDDPYRSNLHPLFPTMYFPVGYNLKVGDEFEDPTVVAPGQAYRWGVVRAAVTTATAPVDWSGSNHCVTVASAAGIQVGDNLSIRTGDVKELAGTITSIDGTLICTNGAGTVDDVYTSPPYVVNTARWAPLLTWPSAP